MSKKIIGIMGAMPEEIISIAELLTEKQEFIIGERAYYTGLLDNIQTVVVFSRWGKVAAATTVTTLILEFKITELIFTGVAGAINPSLKIGDIVIGRRLIQHDMDGRPLMRQFEIPLLGIIYFECENERINVAEAVINDLLNKKHLPAVIDRKDMEKFGIYSPKLFVGDIASGDRFFSSNDDKYKLLSILPETLCVEMEGAAVAQVCHEYRIPFTVIRTISDTADEKAEIDFPSFIKNVSSKYSQEIIKLYYGLF